jgi:hypothetical protein
MNPPSYEEKHKREQLRALCEDAINRDSVFMIGWIPVDPEKSALYTFRAGNGANFRWSFSIDSTTLEPKVSLNEIEYLIRDVDHFKAIISTWNHQPFGASRYVNAIMAMEDVQKVFEASKLKTLQFADGIRAADDRRALEIAVKRIYDVSIIKIEFESEPNSVEDRFGKKPLPSNSFKVTFTREVESTSHKSMFEPPIQKSDIFDVASALQTAVRMRHDLLLVPDVAWDPSESTRSGDPADTSDSGFTDSEFRDYFIQNGASYVTRPLMQPYVYITVKPDVKNNKAKVTYSSGMGVDGGREDQESWSDTSDSKIKAMRLLNRLVRQYITGLAMFKTCLESIFKYRAAVTYFWVSGGFEIIIKGKINGKVLYGDKRGGPVFILELRSANSRTTQYKCYHPTHVASVIDRMIK